MSVQQSIYMSHLYFSIRTACPIANFLRSFLSWSYLCVRIWGYMEAIWSTCCSMHVTLVHIPRESLIQIGRSMKWNILTQAIKSIGTSDYTVAPCLSLRSYVTLSFTYRGLPLYNAIVRCHSHKTVLFVFCLVMRTSSHSLGLAFELPVTSIYYKKQTNTKPVSPYLAWICF